MDMPIKAVGVIGIGSMGDPMARRIADAGFLLTVCDVNAASLTAFAALGATTTTRASDCARCDATIVLVATPDQMRDVVLGAHGLKGHIAAGTPHYLVIMSTVAPKDIQELAQALAGTSIRLVDAPISGGVVGARKGTLTVLAGGVQADVAKLQPVFEAVGKSVFHCGALGAGQTTKIVNNVIAVSNLMFSAEAYRIAQANGLSIEQFMPALEAGSARNFMSRNPQDAPEVYAAWSSSPEQYRAVQTINKKDMALALSLCPPGMSAPAITALRDLIERMGPETLATWQALAGTTIPRQTNT